jgi:hypothetical protein
MEIDGKINGWTDRDEGENKNIFATFCCEPTN